MKTTIKKEGEYLFFSHDLSGELWVKNHPECPGWIAEKIIAGKRRAVLKKAAKSARARADEINFRHLYRDFRPGIGSGRAAHWSKWSFRRYAITAEATHATLGLTGEDCRAVARGAQRVDYPTSQAWEPLSQPKIEQPIGYNAWPAWYSDCVVPRIAEFEAKKELAELEADPGKKIDGYLAADLIAWSHDEPGAYAECSGCERYGWYHSHPETWKFLLSRASIGAVGDGWEQVYPHEQDRKNRLKSAGYAEIMRLNDSIFTAQHPFSRTSPEYR